MTKKEIENKLNELEKLVLDSRTINDSSSGISNYDINERIKNIEFQMDMMRLENHEKEIKEQKKMIDRELEECEYRRMAIEKRRYNC